ncbi:hypothetical protein DFJ74DRAFT_612508 [Hyaloraphidium curvatum]|nr:hypothetical protein DFJ74DRAFT_612508 [Hyaloraphidium curvatum]
MKLFAAAAAAAALAALPLAAAAPLARRAYWADTGVFDFKQCINPAHFALTFDDGPAQHTERLLDTLKAAAAHVTFFVIGQNVQDYPAVVARAFAEGHQIASHTFTHPYLPTISASAVTSELNRTESAVFSAISRRPATMRPPYGEIDAPTGATVRKFNLSITVWSQDSFDWRDQSAAAMVSWAKALPAPGSAGGPIALMHDINSWTVDAAANVIAEIRKKGYTLVTMEECTGAKAYKEGSMFGGSSSTSATSTTSASVTASASTSTVSSASATSTTASSSASCTTATATASPITVYVTKVRATGSPVGPLD